MSLVHVLFKDSSDRAARLLVARSALAEDRFKLTIPNMGIIEPNMGILF